MYRLTHGRLASTGLRRRSLRVSDVYVSRSSVHGQSRGTANVPNNKRGLPSKRYESRSSVRVRVLVRTNPPPVRNAPLRTGTMSTTETRMLLSAPSMWERHADGSRSDPVLYVPPPDIVNGRGYLLQARHLVRLAEGCE